MKRIPSLCLVTLLFVLSGASTALAATVTETFDSYANGTALTAVGGGGVWTIGANTVVNPGGVNGTAGLGTGSPIFNWKGQPFQWSTLAVGTKVAMSLDFQTSASGNKFDDDRVGWTVNADSSTSSGNQFALQLDTAGMECYWDANRTVLNALSGIKNSTWYRFSVEYTKLTATSAGIVGTLTELDASGNPTGTPYVGTIADSSAAPYSAPAARFTSTSQWPSFKNYSSAAGNADNATFTLTPPGPLPPTVTITSPAHGSTVIADWLAMAATATPSTGASVTNVEFYAGAVKIGEDATAPYTMNWCQVAPAAYSLTAVVLDDSGASATSSVVSLALSAPAAAGSLQFDGNNDYVTFGPAPELGLSTFTIECWFKRQGVGKATTTGTGGVTDAVPLVTKGRGEAEGSNVDMNWFLGLSTNSNVLAADFEEGAAGPSPGLNHPVFGSTPLANDVWLHAAATYDGTNWTLYLNGNVEASLAVDRPPRSDSIQHAALASALTSVGSAAGNFQGLLDEVRVWNYARSGTEIADNYNLQITNQTGLVARWALNEGAGLVAFNAICGGVNGDLINGPVWSTGAFDANSAPSVTLTNPVAGSVFAVGSSVTLGVAATDEGSVTNVDFYVDDALVGSDDTSPYSATWLDAELGFHALQAVAWDNTGLSATSAVVTVSAVAQPGYGALSFDGANDHVTMGTALGLGASTFTLECWMRIDGAGVTASSGTGGINVAPLIDKGRGEGDGSNLDCNYIFGVQADNRLAADFEDFQSGLNHPVVGTAALSPGVWHHCAVTYDGSWWRIYIDGTADASLEVTGGGNVQVPRYDSIQHFALGTAMTSTGVPAGFFNGLMDEVRVWNYPRTQTQIANSMYREIASATGLIGRWSLNETNGTTANNTGSSAVNGTLVNGPVWTTGYPLQPAANTPPTVTITSPTNGATVFTSFSIDAAATDDSTVTNVDFYADGGTLLGSDASSPYSYAWSGASAAAHALTAVAWDDAGLSATSAVVNVTVSANVAPGAPVAVAPANNAVDVATNATLTVSVSDPNDDSLSVVFYGRALTGAAPGPDFTIVALPDTQFYSESYPAIFQAQADWIVNNRVAQNLVYVTGEGDVVNVASSDTQFQNATNALYRLENPATTGLAEGIPYGVPVGNHDSPYTLFNTYFGTNHFNGRSYYGGSYATGYQNHYDLFSAGGMDFIVLSLEYNAGANSAIMTWANGVLQANANRRAIVVSHSLLQAGSTWPTPAAWSTDGGTTIFPALTNNPNLFLMLCGHDHGQGRRHEAVGSRFIDVLLSDYQSDANGGNGFLRTMEFSPSNNVIRVKTYSPYTLGSKTDGDNEFTLDYAMSSAPEPFVCLGTNTAVASGTQTGLAWSNLVSGTTYEWYAVASDASLSATGATNQFTTEGVAPQPPTVTLSLTGSPMAEAAGEATVTATLSETNASVVTVNLAFSGTATLTDDYTRSGTSISIPAGNLTGSITLTAVQDTVYESPAETIVVDIDTVENAVESGFQQVTATITDDDPAPSGFTAYNDCSSSASAPANTTQYQGDGTTSGALKDFDTGTILPVTLAITANAVSYNGTGGPMPNSGTDAYDTFDGKVVFDDVVWYTAAFNGFWMDATFTGLDPAKEYEFATSVNRGGSGGDYGDRFSKFTISDLDSAENASTPGVTVNSATSVTFCSGINTVNGYVARWTNIKCGADGDFTVRVEDGGGVGKGYAFDGIMLRETGTAGPQPPAVAITSPADSATVSTNFTITATATDDGTVTNVYFYDGSTLLGNDDTDPYSYTWNSAPLGSHALTAVAWDNDGLAATSAVVNVTVSADGLRPSFTAYNDCSGGDAGNPANTTEIGLDATAPYAGQSGALKDFDTGTTLGVTLSIVNNGAIGGAGTTTGPMPASGTDAYATFDGKVVIANPGVRYGDTTGWWVEARFTGLDPSKEYDFVTTANRGNIAYATRWSKYTLTGADSSVNASSSGVTVNSPTSVSFSTGYNDVSGYVARWTNIKSGSDGAFTVRVENDGSGGHDSNKSYTFDAIMLQESGPAGPQPPAVAITTPADSATVSTNFTITATATDSDGTVTNVYFYDGSTLLGNDDTGPAYSYAWDSAPLGSHALTVVGWDNDGLAATSAVVNVTVTVPGAVAATETFDSYANGMLLTNIGGGGVWTIGPNTVLSGGGVNGSAGISTGNAIFNWKAQPFQWSALAVGTKVAMSLDFQSSPTGKFDDDRVGWTIDADSSGSSTHQLALQLDNTTEGGMVVYWNSTRTVLNALSGIQNSTWYRFNVEFTKLTGTSAGIVGTLTELDASGNPTGTPYVGTVTDTATFVNPPDTARFTSTSQWPSFKNYSNADGNADNATFTITPPGPQPLPITVTADSGQSKVFGAADPTFTYVSSDPGVTFTGALGRAAGEDVGSYAINQGDLSAGTNYVITFVPADFAITPASSTTAISSSLNPSAAGANVTFTVTVGPVAPATTTPTGNVQFLTNDVAVGSPVSLTGGTATLDTALLPPGTNTVTASYLGDGNYAGSTNSLLQVVTAVVETPSVLGIALNGEGSVTVTFAGTPGAEYLVLGSTNIASPGSWANVSTNTAGPDGQWTYTDNTTTNYTQRFFRAAKP